MKAFWNTNWGKIASIGTVLMMVAGGVAATWQYQPHVLRADLKQLSGISCPARMNQLFELKLIVQGRLATTQDPVQRRNLFRQLQNIERQMADLRRRCRRLGFELLENQNAG